MNPAFHLNRLVRRALLVVALLPAAAFAQLAAQDAWVRATPGDLKLTGAFMTLTSPAAVRVLRAESPVAGRVELHETTLQDNVMKMREVKTIDVPAGGAVQLKPGGLHVMLIDLKQPLKEGEVVPLTFVYEEAGARRELAVKVPVRALTGAAPAAGHAHGHDKGHKAH